MVVCSSHKPSKKKSNARNPQHLETSCKPHIVPSIRKFYCEKHSNSRLIKVKDPTDSTVSAREPGHPDKSHGIPCRVEGSFFSQHCMIVIVWFLLFLLHNIFIKSLSHPEHILYTPPKLSHSSQHLLFSHNHWIVFLKQSDYKVWGCRESLPRPGSTSPSLSDG